MGAEPATFDEKTPGNKTRWKFQLGTRALATILELPDWETPTKSDEFRYVADELINLFRTIRIRTGQGRLENVPSGETSF